MSLFPPEAIVGFQVLRYSIEEGPVEIAACIQVHSPSDDCPIDFSFTVTLTTRDGTAGEHAVTHITMNESNCFVFCPVLHTLLASQRVLVIIEQYRSL